MFRRLPYRIQIPVGLSVAVILTALLVTAVSAKIYAGNARLEALATLDRGVVLIVAQARPLLAADDTWRMFSLLRDTAALIPGATAGKGRLAVLDADGRVFAASDPTVLETGLPLIGTNWHGQHLQAPEENSHSPRLDQPDGAVMLLEPIRSEDGQLLGHVFMEVEASVFAPDWFALVKSAMIGVVLAVALLLPLGWLVGARMTQPVARIIKVIERIGYESPSKLRSAVPVTQDPELSRIGNAIVQLIGELEKREQSEERVLSAERLAAVGRITAAVAHEINNPLMGLLTATKTLRLHGESAAVRDQTLNLLDRGLQQIRTTVAALLPQARIEDRPLDPSDLDDVVTLVQVAVTENACKLDAYIEVESALRVPSAPMRQVMLNMLLNAIKAAGSHGVVEAVLKADAQQVAFIVSNSGPALSVEKFNDTLEAESGRDPRGFGLWVCKELANHYRGGFELDPHAFAGTRLVFWLPNHEST
jgi:two-component system, NtrC family, sensor kinase